MNQFESRRAFLRGLGASISLPVLTSLPGWAAASAPILNRSALTSSGMPQRMAFLYVPNGVIGDQWYPTGAGTEFKLPESTSPLEPHRQHLQFLSGLEHQNGWAGRDGAGDHARANATILTGARPKKTAGADIRLGVSVDQYAAQRLERVTRFSSLELSCDGVRKSGSCDSGYSCAYQYNLSWRNENTPMAPESNPRAVFERLFGSGDANERAANRETRRARQQSILDFVMQDADAMKARLGQSDQYKLDEYLTGVREIERRIEEAERFSEVVDVDQPAPEGIPKSYRDHIRLMMDMMILAFQTDQTRIGTFLLAHDGSNRSFPEIGISEGHHAMSHHRDDKRRIGLLAKIDKFYIEQLGYFLQRMQELKDQDGSTLLHNSSVVFASGLSDGNRHRHDNLPVIVAGKGGGSWQTGRHQQLEKQPMTNLFVTMLQNMGVETDQFGDSSGQIQLS